MYHINFSIMQKEMFRYECMDAYKSFKYNTGYDKIVWLSHYDNTLILKSLRTIYHAEMPDISQY